MQIELEGRVPTVIPNMIVYTPDYFEPKITSKTVKIEKIDKENEPNGHLSDF